MLSIIKKYKFVIKQLVNMDLKRKYNRSFLGIMWSVLNPLLMMFVISLVFTQLFKRTIENYPMYYLSGNVVWIFFTGATNSALTSILDNRRLITKISVPKILFPICKVCSNLVSFGYVMIAYAIMMVIFKIKPTITIISMPLIILAFFIFIIGFSFILSALYIFFADLKYLYSVFTTALMYTCALFYPIDIIPEAVLPLFKANPIYNYVNCFRNAMMYNTFPSFGQWIQCFGWAIGIYIIGYVFFKKNENKIMFYL